MEKVALRQPLAGASFWIRGARAGVLPGGEPGTAPLRPVAEAGLRLRAGWTRIPFGGTQTTRKG
jgi:hypothetical protein